MVSRDVVTPFYLLIKCKYFFSVDYVSEIEYRDDLLSIYSNGTLYGRGCGSSSSTALIGEVP